MTAVLWAPYSRTVDLSQETREETVTVIVKKLNEGCTPGLTVNGVFSKNCSRNPRILVLLITLVSLVVALVSL